MPMRRIAASIGAAISLSSVRITCAPRSTTVTRAPRMTKASAISNPM
jgi:hypothetical protein